MKTTFRSLVAGVLVLGLSTSHAGPMTGIERELAAQRACEAAIWAMPAVSLYDIEASVPRDLGGAAGDVVFFSQPMTSRHGFLTANDVTPYVVANLNTEGGPLVVEVPPAGGKASFFGTFVDAWQTPIADVGPPGDDKGQGGRYLFLPPGYEGAVPEGFLVYRPRTYTVGFAFRPVARNGGGNADQVAYAQTVRVYRLEDAADPPPTRFVDAYPHVWNTLPQYDMNYFLDLNTVIQREPVLARDKAMMAMLATLGIEKGKPFEPGEDMSAALTKGLQCAYDAMQHYFSTPGKAMVPWWPGSQWQVWNFAEGQPEIGFPYETPERLLIDERAGGSYFWITYLPKNLGGGTFYLTGLRDSGGELMNGRGTYRLKVPSNTPAADFWSVIVYSMRTKGFVEGVERVGLSSQQIDAMVKNADGSVDVWFAPEAPPGRESNWIPTGEDFFLLFRLYGPEKPLFDKSWMLGDVERLQ